MTTPFVMRKRLSVLSNPRRGAVTRLSALCLAASILCGCAGYAQYQDGKNNIEAGQPVQGLDSLRRAMEQNPNDVEYRTAYFRERDIAVADALREMEAAIDTGDFAYATVAATKARRLDMGQPRTLGAFDHIAVAQRQSAMLDQADAQFRQGRADLAAATIRQVLAEDPSQRRANLLLRQVLRKQADTGGRDLGLYPKLREAFRKPVSLTLTNASLLQVFDALKQVSGLNFMFDREVKQDSRVTISVANKSVEDVLRLLLATNQLERRTLDDDTVLIYPNTPQKSREYQELVVRSFYMSNSDINKAATLVKTIAKARDVFVDEKLNLLVVRDTAEVIRLSEKLLANQDLADPEVMLDLEVMEVSTNRLTELGIRWPDAVSASVVGSLGTVGTLTPSEARNFNSGLVRLKFNDPLIAAQLRSQRGDSNLLANPRIRVRNRQTAKILIGERVPVITTSSTANVGTYESVNYLDVGLKLEVEPSVSLDDEVAMKVALEVSNILETITRSSGLQAYRLGTRNATTQLRVRDGETQILAGLIQRDERKSNNGVPGLNDVPVINKLFGQGSDQNVKTEIVLLITPRIVRNIDVPGAGQIEILSGTEAASGAAPIQLNPAVGGVQTQPQIPQQRFSNEQPLNGGTPAGTPAPVVRPLSSFGQTPTPAPTSTPAQSGLTAPPMVPASPN